MEGGSGGSVCVEFVRMQRNPSGEINKWIRGKNEVSLYIPDEGGTSRTSRPVQITWRFRDRRSDRGSYDSSRIIQ